jgi:putative ABC transport system ATP-binding protein
MATIVKVEEVTKTYVQGSIEVPALKGVSLDIEQGDFCALAGPSGSGKTTLLNIIGGLDDPTSGKVYISDQEITQLSSTQKADMRLNRIGFVFQAYNLIPVLSAIENVEFVMLLQGIPVAERTEKARNILIEVGLEQEMNRRPLELSGGQQQRVAVARAIVSEPEIVLADEPTANLDSKTGAALLDMMLEMNKVHGVTFVFSTHDRMVMERARKLYKMRDGLLEETTLNGVA